MKRNEIGSKNRYSTPAFIALWFALVLSLVCSPAFTDEHDGNTAQQFSPESTTDTAVEPTNSESEPETQTSSVPSDDVTTGVSANKAKPQVRTLPSPRSNLSHGQSRDNTGNWRYALKPEDNVWTVAESFLNQRYSWVDLVRFNQIKDPNQVKTGNTLLIPISWLKVQPAPAKALSVSGEALLKRSQQRTFDPIVKNTLLNVGDTLRTLNGSILVQFADGSVLRIEENTTLIFNRLSQFGKSGMTDTGLRLEKGRVSTRVQPVKENGSRYEITTPSAVAAVRGTEFRLASDGNGSQAEVTEGVVLFTTGNKEITLPAGYGASSDVKSGLQTIVSLPAAPQPANLPTLTNTLPITLTWQPVKDIQQYRYQLFKQNENGDLVESDLITKPDITLTNLVNGQYLVAMRAVGSQGFEGTDYKHTFTVKVRATPVQLVAPANNQQFDYKQPVFSWKMPPTHELARLEIAVDDGFEKTVVQSNYIQDNAQQLDVQLSPGYYYWRVQTLAGSEDIAHSETRRLAIKGKMEATSILSVNYSGNRVKVFWKSIPVAESYEVQLSKSPEFTIIQSQETVTDPNIAIRLDEGERYYIRVRGIANELWEPQYSLPYELTTGF